MNVFAAELRAQRRSTLTWVAALVALVVLFMAMFPAFSSDVEASKALLERFPPALRAVFGLSIDQFFTVYGFFAYLSTFLTLVAAMQAATLGVSALSREELLKTSDFLLSKPISRARVVTAKLLAAALLLVLTNLALIVAALAAAAAAVPAGLDAPLFLLLTLNVAVIQFAFLALGFLLSVVVPRIKSVVAIALPTVFLFFVIGMLDAVLGNEAIRYLTPFKYVDPLFVIDHRSYESPYLLVGAGVAAAALGLTYAVYLRRDTRAAA